MPNRSSSFPKYRHYKPKGLAVVRIDGRDHYLGKHGSPESWERYHRLLAERSSGLPSPAPVPDSPSLPVSGLILAYWKHAQSYYRRPDGSPSAEQENIKLSLRPLRKLYGMTTASEFGPIALKLVRQSLIDSGLARTTINQRVGKIVRVFRWGVENEMVPASSHHALKAVPGLRKGRTSAPETKLVRPVSDGQVDAIRPHVSRQVWAMIELQRLTAARSTEVATMRTRDLDISGDVWIYRPGGHKTAHHGKSREVLIGPRAIDVVKPWLRPDPDAFLFQPREAVEEWRAGKRRDRKSPLTPSQRARASKARPGRTAGDRYDARAYAHAVARACDRAFPHPTIRKDRGKPIPADRVAELAAWRKDHRWHPHQLRHSAATAVRARFGLEAAQVVLGHSRADVTQVYAERDLAKARDVMREIG